MPVHQVEEYYLHVRFNNPVTDSQRHAICELLDSEGYSNYEFQDGGECLVVYDVPSEHEGEVLEEQVVELTSN